MSPTDHALLQATAAGDDRAFRQLFDRHHGAAVRLARRVAEHPEDADDAVQEAFLAVHRHAATFRADATFATWLYRIVVNHSLKHRRSARRRDARERALPLDEFAAVTVAASDEELRRVLDREIDRLPLRQRMVFALVVVEGVAIDDAATVVGLRPGTVRYHLTKARERLRERLRATSVDGLTEVKP